MNAAQQNLYERLVAFQFDDPGAELTFERRLARENGWSTEYARQVVGEYKRFMFLAIVAGHPVTPSQQVDQAWHLHLVYTRSYWDDLCAGVLGQRVHHGPTKGGSGEQTKYREWYQRTKASYARLLGESPPANIWPATDVRFGDDLYERWINTRRNLVIPKPRIVSWAVAWIVFALSALVIASVLVAQPIDSVLPYTSTRHSQSKGLYEKSRAPKPDSKYRQPSFDNGDDSWIIWLVAPWLCAFIVGLLYWFFSDPYFCPTCKRSTALTLTGKNNSTESSAATQQEWQCKYCDYRTWKGEAAAGSCGGCGDGGCGGCGCGGCGG